MLGVFEGMEDRAKDAVLKMNSENLDFYELSGMAGHFVGMAGQEHEGYSELFTVEIDGEDYGIFLQNSPDGN